MKAVNLNYPSHALPCEKWALEDTTLTFRKSIIEAKAQMRWSQWLVDPHLTQTTLRAHNTESGLKIFQLKRRCCEWGTSAVNYIRGQGCGRDEREKKNNYTPGPHLVANEGCLLSLHPTCSAALLQKRLCRRESCTTEKHSSFECAQERLSFGKQKRQGLSQNYNPTSHSPVVQLSLYIPSFFRK